MKCIQCHYFFCWLCNSKIESGNPYHHFDDPALCNQKLFEGTISLPFLFFHNKNLIDFYKMLLLCFPNINNYTNIYVHI